MTNTRDQAAREWALMHVYDQAEQIAYSDKSKVKPLAEKAHLAGQSVGYKRGYLLGLKRAMELSDELFHYDAFREYLKEEIDTINGKEPK